LATQDSSTHDDALEKLLEVKTKHHLPCLEKFA
jgi:hypothetical protein